jgi:hypothetical protein
MAMLLIAYDLNKETTRPPIVEAIRKIGSAVKLSESAYAIETHQQPDIVYNEIKPLIDSNDHLYVIPLKGPYAGYGPKTTIDTLDSKL